MAIKKSGQNKQEDIMEVFENIKNPEDLLVFMNDNIFYGFVGRDSKKIFKNEKEMDVGWWEYHLQSPEELLESKHGVCWDMVELERLWFARHGYESKI